MKGVYIVFLRLDDERSIEVGALGEVRFDAGVYAYVGSAMTSLESRLGRHFSHTENLHWHIDYLSSEAEAIGFMALVTEDSSWECRLAETILENAEPVKDFGCSDCSCNSHLVRVQSTG